MGHHFAVYVIKIFLSICVLDIFESRTLGCVIVPCVVQVYDKKSYCGHGGNKN